MRVIVAVFSYWPEVNGVQSVAQYQAEGLISLGHQVKVLTSLHRTNKLHVDNHNGVEIERLNLWTSQLKHRGAKNQFRSKLVLEARQADVVVLTCPETWSVDCALPVLDKLQCATVLMVHGIHDFRRERAKDSSIYAKAKKAITDVRWWPYYQRNWKKFRSFDAVMQLDAHDFGYQYFKSHGVESKVLHNAVDELFFMGGKEKKKRIINVGTYHRRKNQIACLDAFYRAGLEDYELMLIGPVKNDYYQRLLRVNQKLEGTYGHRNVRIIVGESRSDTIRHVRESQIYLLTSVTEMQPVSLLEAMATGSSFVSTDVGVNRYLPGGLIRNSVDDMAEALEYLTADDHWKTYGKLGSEYAEENCRMETQIKRLESILQEAVERHG